jgi:hypothetical protein
MKTHFRQFTFSIDFLEDSRGGIFQMRKSTAYCRTCVLFLAALAGPVVARAQTVIPQIVDGGGWQTTMVLTNTSSSSAQISITFNQETGGGPTAPWSPPFIDTNTTQNVIMAPGGTVIIHTAGTASTTTVGWAEVQGSSAVSVYAIFAQTVTGRPNQDGTGVAAPASSRVLVPYDNTNGFVTSIAIANTGPALASIAVGLQNTFGNGPVSPAPAPINLPALGHTSFTMPQQFPAAANQSGTLELTTNGGSISVIALHFNPTGSFASAPVYPESGAAILGSGTGGTGTVGAFTRRVGGDR